MPAATGVECGQRHAHFHGQVQALPVPRQVVHDAQALVVVAVVGIEDFAERFFAGVAEGRVAEVVCQGDGLDQIFVQAQRAGDGAADLRDFQRMGQPVR